MNDRSSLSFVTLYDASYVKALQFHFIETIVDNIDLPSVENFLVFLTRILETFT